MYTDKKLAMQMAQLLQNHVIIEKPRELPMLGQLLNDPTETNVRAKLVTGSMTEVGLKGKFTGYWVALGHWIKQQGGDLDGLSGRGQNGRTGGNVTSTPDKALYDDAFAQTRSHINDSTFSVPKAIANHLRFINHFEKG